MSRPIRPFDPDAWVAAAPFAAHLHRLCADSGLSWQVIAMFAGVPLRTASRLVPGPGTGSAAAPRLRRIPRTTAHRLWSVQPEELARLRHTWVPAGPTCARIAQLVAAGVAPRTLCEHLACTPEQLAALVDGGPATVTVELAVRARVAAETTDRALTRRAVAAA